MGSGKSWCFVFSVMVLCVLAPGGNSWAGTLETVDIHGVRVEYFVPSALEPELSEDGRSLTHAALPVVLIADPTPADPPLRIPPPSGILDEEGLPLPHRQTAVFSITYAAAGEQDPWGEPCSTFPENARAAFDAAAAVWAGLLTSSVPITIRACWASLTGGTLGYSGGGNLYRDFPNAPQSGTWYTESLANALRGADNGPGSFDMHITYNQNFSWYFGTDGNTPAGQHDFMSVVLHEIGHGLNFAGSMNYSGGSGSWGYNTGYPNVYDTLMRDGSGNGLTNTGVYPNPSTTLGTALTSNNLWFHGADAMAANGGQRVKMYAPGTWAPGSSYSHLDYATFAGTVNRLMVYAISSGSSIHDPGPVTLGLLKDLGWPSSAAPVCGTPTSISVPSSSSTGSYTVSWGSSSTAGVTYVLEEAMDGGFTSNLRTAYSGTGTSASITGRASGNTYYYRVKATKAGYTDSGWRTGSNGCTVSIGPCTLGDAVDAPALDWTTTGSADWFCQTSVTHDGIDAAQSGKISHDQMTVLQTTVTGPGVLSFWWKVSSEEFWDFLIFSIDSVEQESISGEVGWHQMTFEIGAGTHTLHWIYEKDYSLDAGADAGWVDQVVWSGSSICGTPASISVPSSSSTGSYTVSWGSSSTEGVTYVLEEATDAGFTSGLRTAYSGIGTSASITGRTSGSTYYYRVKATKAGFTDSDWRTGSNGCIVVIICGTPASISVPSSSNTGSYTVSWGSSSTAGVTYVLEEATDAGFTSGLRTAYSGIGTSASITGRTSGSTYYYRVKATRVGYTDSAWRTGSNGCTVNIGPCTLGDAVDAPSLVWKTGGNAEWFCQSAITHDGVGAAQSGAISNSQETWLQTSVTGPGTLSFYWKVSSEAEADVLSFFIGAALQVRISGNVDWQQRIITVPEGTHLLRWSYSKNQSGSQLSDAGWLDRVSWTEGSGILPGVMMLLLDE